MDLRLDSGTAPTHTAVGVAVLEQEVPLSNTRCPTESGGTILLQLLEFKTHLLEAVEELHIRRDAETRFEDQISKLVLEKQELEWEKESLQHQAGTAANQHTESLTNVKKQFQAKIRNIEEEKGKYQVSAELKDKEINNLKEELKSLQLLKYNLEKKSSELEQKQALQSRSKDSHLNQLGEVEKRFGALSRLCAMVKQAHEKLERNVDEAMKMNTKLSLANGKQDATIVLLNTELEEVRNKLIKAKMPLIAHEKTQSPTGRDQHAQQMQQKLNMETEMNKKLRVENEVMRAEKQEVMRSLQNTQQLLLSQTQTVSRVEMELQTQREKYQALKQEHEVMREKSKALEERVSQLTKSYAASKTSWDKEKVIFLDQMKSEHQDLPTVKEAYSKLQLKHTELSSQAKVQAQHIYELEIKDSSQSQHVPNQLFSTLVGEFRGEETIVEPISRSEVPTLSSLQSLASIHTDNPNRLEDTGAVNKLVITGATEGQDPQNRHQLSQIEQLLKPLNSFTCSSTNNNVLGLSSHSGTTKRDNSIIKQYLYKPNTEVVLDWIDTTSSASDVGLMNSKSPDNRSTAETLDLLNKENIDGTIGGISRKEQESKDDVKNGKNNRDQREHNKEHFWNSEKSHREDVKERESSGEQRRTLMVQTTDRADIREDSQWSTEDSGNTERPETETRDIAEGEGTDGAEGEGKIGLDTPETQLSAQTITDTTAEKSDAPQSVDFMDTESLAACESSDCSQSRSKKVSEKDADSSPVRINREERIFLFSSEHESVSLKPNSDNQEVQHPGHGEVQISAQDQVYAKTTEEKLSNVSTANISFEPSEPVNLSNVRSLQVNTTLLAAQSDDTVSIQELEATIPQVQPCNPSENIAHDAQETVGKSSFKDTFDDILVATVDLESVIETVNSQHMKNDKMEDTEQAMTTKHETDLKLQDPLSHENEASLETGRIECCEESTANEMLPDDTNDPLLPSIETYRSSFSWGNAPRKLESPFSEQNTSGYGRVPGHPPSTIPMFLISKHNKVPLVIHKASDLLNASSVSGSAASSKRHQQGETATAETKTRASPAITSFPASPSSITDSLLSWQTTPGCSRAPSSAAGTKSQSDWELSCSPEREDQQSSFRAQISKIEQFLNTERLRLPKRRKTDN